MSIQSIQSSVAVIHAGNSTAVFPLKVLSFEVWQYQQCYFQAIYATILKDGS